MLCSTVDQWPCEKEDVQEGAKRTRVTRKQLESLEQRLGSSTAPVVAPPHSLTGRTAGLQACYNELSRPSISSMPHQTAPSSVVSTAALDDLATVSHWHSRHGRPTLHDAGAAVQVFELNATGQQSLVHTPGTVCDPFTSLLDPDWPKTLPPPRITVGAVRELFATGHPATQTIPREVYETIGLSPRSPTFPHLGLLHVCLACSLLQKVKRSLHSSMLSQLMYSIRAPLNGRACLKPQA